MDPNDNQEPRRGISRSTWVLIGFLAVAAYFLFSEHRAHFIYYLPFVLLAACPLMHLFHGHGGHGRHSTKRDDQPTAGAQHRH
jgi:Protein of unknown function (DUF2933)